MFKRLTLSIIISILLLGTGTAFGGDIPDSDDIAIWSGKTTKADILSQYGEPTIMTRDLLGREKLVYIHGSQRLEVVFEEDLVWTYDVDSRN